MQTQPRLLVQLGALAGMSWAAFYHAVAQASPGTRCVAAGRAVTASQGDRGQGDRGQGAPDGDRGSRGGAVAPPSGMDPDGAAARFADGSIDLLYIAGSQGGPDVRFRFGTWQPKLSDRAVIVVDDIDAGGARSGRRGLWDALSARYPHFLFRHAGGPGVLAVGSAVAPAIGALCAVADPIGISRLRAGIASARERGGAANRSIPDPSGVAAMEQANRSLRRQIHELAAAPAADAPGPAATAGTGNDPARRLRISVVIPLYDGARFIAEALDSVLKQTMPPAEIIVVDDGSTDDGPALVARMAARHPITLLHRAHRGQSAARNAGIAISTGSHVALLDQDDIWYPEHLQRLSQPFQVRQDRQLGWVYSNLDEIEEDGSMRIRACLRLGQSPHPKRDLLQCLGHDMFVLPSASLISRAAFDAVGGFDESLSGYEDDDLFLRLFRAGYACVYVSTPLSQWRVYFSSASFSPAMMRSRMTYFRKLAAQFPDDPRRHVLYVRDLLGPRFLATTMRDYLVALRCRDFSGARVAADGLAFVAQSNKAWIRLLFALLRPLLRRPVLARPLLPLTIGLRPLLRRALR